MYHTPEGDRTLCGAERSLFVAALSDLLEAISDARWSIGIELFDALQPGQKVAVMHLVATALLDDQVQPVELTAVVEGTVAAIFYMVGEGLSDELALASSGGEGAEGDQPDCDLGVGAGGRLRMLGTRELVRKAVRETRAMEQVPKASEMDLDEWLFAVDALRDRILWDSDWQMVEFQDLAPDVANAMKELQGISDDYFVDVISEPTESELAAMVQTLHELCRDA